jgi:hypothetical protein
MASRQQVDPFLLAFTPPSRMTQSAFYRAAKECLPNGVYSPTHPGDVPPI